MVSFVDGGECGMLFKTDYFIIFASNFSNESEVIGFVYPNLSIYRYDKGLK